MQRQVLNEMRVEVHKVKIYDGMSDEYIISRRMATTTGAEIMRGEIIPGTKVLIYPSQLEHGEQWTERDFVPDDQ